MTKKLPETKKNKQNITKVTKRQQKIANDSNRKQKKAKEIKRKQKKATDSNWPLYTSDADDEQLSQDLDGHLTINTTKQQQ